MSPPLFTNFDPDFNAFLTRTAASTDNIHWSVARNFLLDEGVGRERAQCYKKHGVMMGHGDAAAWRGKHTGYLQAEVSIQSDDFGPPDSVDPDEDTCPETFRFPRMPFSSLGDDLDAYLVRVEHIDTLARVLVKRWNGAISESESCEKVLAWAKGALMNDPRASQDLDGLFKQFSKGRDLCPVFAGVWADVSDLFGDAPEGDVPGWADSLRDRLGLQHHDPKQPNDGIDVLVFRYPVHAVPRLSNPGDRQRPLVAPCVLDGDLSDAFLPSPRASDTGHTVDLAGARSCDGLTREILHPAMRLRAKYLFRVGAITRPVAPDVIGVQRGLHLSYLRELFHYSTYAQHTDGDLL